MSNFRNKQNIEAISYLSPLQQGMLAHALQEGTADPYFYQSTFDIEGELDIAAFGQAWQAVVAKYPVLRTDYRWEEIARPVQIVYRAGAAHCETLDLREHSEAGQDRELAALLAQEREQGFDFRRAADNRLRLVRLSERRQCLVWSYHHITLDGWSLALILRDVLAAYRCAAGGAAPQLASARPYRDYLQWLQGQDMEAARSYWRGALAGGAEPTPLPVSGGSASDGHAEQVLHLAVGETAALRAFAAAQQLTLNTVVQGAWAVLLGRHARNDEVTFGCTVSGRPADLAGVEEMAGLFINTQPLRVSMPGALPVAQWLRGLQQQAVAQRQFDYLPPGEVPAQFDSIVVFENYPIDASLTEGRAAIRMRHVRRGQQSAGADGVRLTGGRNNYALSLIVKDGAEMELLLAYDGRRFAHPVVAGLLRQLGAVLTALRLRPDATLASLTLCGEAERGRIVAQAAGERTDVAFRTIAAHIADHAHDKPDAPALRYEDQQLSWRELDQRSSRVANYLAAHGVAPEVRVAVCLPRSLDMVVALLGILKAGGVAVPLDPRMPAERLAFQRADSRAVLTIDASFDATACAATPLPQQCIASNAAYIIYTSGSTGRPKGVVVTHGALSNYVAAVRARLGEDDIASMAWVSTVAADLGHTVLFGALASGACLHVISEERAFDPDRFAEYMALHRIDALKIVPSHLAGLLQAADPAQVLPRRCLVLGGEASSWQLVERLRMLAPGCRLLNHYGPTETTVGVLTFAHDAARPDSRILPLGRPLANNQVYVLDAHLHPVPAGVPGEIYVAGAQLARGYLERPDLTAERFIPNPFGDGSRLYRTGDIARVLEDGNVEYMDRADNQVKIRGYRVEPGEIAAQLTSEPGITDAVVVLAKSGDVARLVGYILAAPDCDLALLKERLAARLPDYMVPSALVRLDAWPLTANGKLDRRALPAPETPATASAGRVAPRNDVEAVLAMVWRDVLKLDEVGVFDSFFALGGDSILSLQVIAKARAKGLKLTPKQMFDKPTIAAIAQVAVPLLAKAKAAPPAPGGDVPLTPIQAWFFEQRLAAPDHWNQSVLLAAPEALDAACLDAALRALVRHHDALRLRFVKNGVEVRQWHDPQVPDTLLQTIAMRTGADIADACSRVQAGLNIAHGPLLAAALLRIDSGGERLLIAVHHLAVDGVSWRILLEDLQTAYTQACAGQVPVLPASPTSWRDWAGRLRSHAPVAQLSYWQSALRPMPLPAWNADGERRAGDARRVELALDAEATRQLLQVAPGAYRTQINDLLLTALAQTLQEWSGSAHALIELEGHGREDLFDDLDLSRTVGWFTSRFPVCLDAAREPADAIKSVKEQLRAIPDKGIGFGLLKHGGDAAARAAIEALPRPQVCFNYLGQFGAQQGAHGFRLATEGTGVNRAAGNRRSHALDVVAQVSDGILAVSWNYSPDVVDGGVIDRLAVDYLARLRALVAHCVTAQGGATPSDFPLAGLTQGEIDHLPVAAIEDMYPLAPMQQGMLFHSLYAPQQDIYVNQLRGTLTGALDVDAFQAAWIAAVGEHAILRTGFLTERAGQTIQIVWRDAVLPFAVHDWRDLNAAEHEARLAHFLDQERACGFDLARAPLIRVALIARHDGATEFVWTKHHLLLDGWSSARLIGEILARYFDGAQGAPTAQPARYRDYVEWIGRQPHDVAERFWRDTLDRLSAPLRLADAVARPSGAPQGHGEKVLHLPAALSGALQGIAQGGQVTLNTVLQAAWALLLSRYSGRDDVVFGVTVSGRSADVAGIEAMLGLFINTLPMFQRLDPGQEIGAWLRQLQGANAALRQHESTALADIQRWSSGGGTALFDTLFVFENYPVDAAARHRQARLAIENVHAHNLTSYPLSLTVVPGERLRIDFVHDRAHFDDATVTRMQGHLLRVLEGLVDQDNRVIGDLPLLDDAEWRSLTRNWNKDVADYPYGGAVHDRFARQAAATPDAVALVHGDQAMSYRELNLAANRVAHRLIELGAVADARVAICLERGLDLVVAIIGVLKSGAGYVPLDPAYPADRLAYMLDDSAPMAIITACALGAGLPAAGVPLLYVDDDAAALAGQPASNPDPAAVGLRPEHLAYVIYTSGSTGKPKGVMVEHRNVTRLFLATDAWFGFGASDVWTLFHSFAFDFSVWEIWGALAYGGKLVVVPAACARSADEFHALLCRERVTILNQTPSAFRALAVAQAHSDDRHALRHVIFGGEALELHTLKPWIERNDPDRTQLTNMYGITEITVHATYRRLRRQDIDEADGSMVGGPIPDLRICILDGQRRPVPVGVTGELYVGGAGVARGYLNRPDLTRERFIADPFSDDPQARLYKTGDLGRWRANGDIEYLGRNDFQVKIRGFRIELGEIEARLAACQGVRDAVVIAREDRPGDKRLVAYYLGEHLAADQLRVRLSLDLADYMVPVAFVRVESWPLTPNGKLDRNALPAPEYGAAAQSYAAPRNDTETALARIWSDLLGVGQVGIHDNFFALGGHSLLAMQVASRASLVFGKKIALATIFQKATIAELAPALRREMQGQAGDVSLMADLLNELE
ncbi:amino acid adenylation domain-containing protein [Massilia sp. CCM 8695]|uniref:Amino acid adenylation domain-containing protein n=1 Tax=Massilia frigida TaxID=2609281 RepID=A0ABX0NHQ6_9BURK|nr:non-ribosomal peptide synthetase [Massilia frigida]NHZ83276.1 amino acid adenylation domain-containing protein [Massilia frigida]